jgi:ABC-type uncharacterized transport system permease subunit
MNHPSHRDLVVFGLLLGPFAALMGLVLHLRVGPEAGIAAWCGLGALLVAYVAVPRARSPIYRAWLGLFRPLGWAVSCVVALVVYYLVVTPVGLALRLAGRDPLRRRSGGDAPSFWVERDPTPEPERYFRQF